jgi:hypothetical protein
MAAGDLLLLQHGQQSLNFGACGSEELAAGEDLSDGIFWSRSGTAL